MSAREKRRNVRARKTKTSRKVDGKINMLTGVGCDLIEIERMKKACEKEAFLLRVYTEEERRQADGRPSVLAGTFAVKEAVAKVLGTGFRTFMPKDVEVLRDELGKPYVLLHGNASFPSLRIFLHALA